MGDREAFANREVDLLLSCGVGELQSKAVQSETERQIELQHRKFSLGCKIPEEAL